MAADDSVNPLPRNVGDDDDPFRRVRLEKLAALQSLGIDPYPRKMGAEFAPLKTDVKTDDGSARPFAALEALKKNIGGT